MRLAKVHDNGTMGGFSIPLVLRLASTRLASVDVSIAERSELARIIKFAESHLATNPVAFKAVYGRDLHPLWEGNGPLPTMPDQGECSTYVERRHLKKIGEATRFTKEP